VRADELVEEEIGDRDPTRLEVSAGARGERHLNDLQRLFARHTPLPIEPTGR
jgi:hypothetical protein